MATHSIALDIPSSCPIGDLLQFMETYNAQIFDYEVIGPGGGNPLITFSFDNAVDMHLFSSAYWALNGFSNEPVPLSQIDQPE